MPRPAAVSLALAVALGACGPGGPSFCEQAAELEEWDPSGGELAAQVEHALDALDGLAEEAPPAVADDVATVRRGLEALARGRERPGRDYAEASERVRAAVDEECG